MYLVVSFFTPRSDRDWSWAGVQGAEREKSVQKDIQNTPLERCDLQSFSGISLVPSTKHARFPPGCVYGNSTHSLLCLLRLGGLFLCLFQFQEALGNRIDCRRCPASTEEKMLGTEDTRREAGGGGFFSVACLPMHVNHAFHLRKIVGRHVGE